MVSEIIISMFSSVASGAGGYFFGIRKQRVSKKLEFIEKQLNEFYGPLLGCYTDLKAKIEFGAKLTNLSDITWREVCEKNPPPFHEHEEYFEPFQKSIEYNNEQWTNEIFPLYEKMLSIFREKMDLADIEIREFYPVLSDFIDMGKRWRSGALPREGLIKINYGNEKLDPFFRTLKTTTDKLRHTITK